MKLTPAEETSRRARAAIAYAGEEQDAIQPRTGISPSTFRRIVAKTNPRAAGLDELYAIADACGVPRRFMVEGMTPLEVDERAELAAALNRVDALEAKQAADQVEMQKQIAALERSIGRLAKRDQR